MAIRKTRSKGPTREQRAAIIQRFLKSDQNINWPREMATFSRLWKAYPSLSFWTLHELPFGQNTLNYMTWFESTEGKAHLESAWLLFHYEPPLLETILVESPKRVLDNKGEPVYNAPYTEIPVRPRTVAEFLKTL